MTRTELADRMVGARHDVRLAVEQLAQLRDVYDEDRSLPSRVRVARMEAINSKIAALNGVVLDARAHPWEGDWKPTPEAPPISVVFR